MIVGLTGSIAMGKTATAEMFRKLGYPVFDADAAVHDLYAKGGEGAKKIKQYYPDVIEDGAVNRGLLVKKISENKEMLSHIEKIIHPLVGALEKDFVAKHKEKGIKLIIMDIPLLFEAGRTKDVDLIVVVSASPEIQRQRAMQRSGMTEKKLDLIIARQLPDKEKRARADHVIDTSISLDDAFKQVKLIVKQLDPDNSRVNT